MTDYLLDTHTAIWYFNGNGALSKTAKRIIDDSSNRVYISIASAWELAIKIGLGKLNFDGKANGFIRFAQTNDIAVVPIKSNHLTALEGLPLIHRDPFDRIITATAITEQMTIITSDTNIALYDVPHIW